MSKIEVDAIDKQSGSTLTLGGSGTAVTLASGATQTGFGRTGTVDWQTGSIKTSTFTAANGEGYFVNTTGGAVTANLPSSPSAGNIVAIKDYTGTANTNAITVGRGGSNIRSVAADFEITKNNGGATFIYVDATEGWQVFADGSDADVQGTFICASVSGSGNTLATAPDCSNMKIATFTGPGTFTVNSISDNAQNNIFSYVMVGGGGGGNGDSSLRSGGGGAGGYREVVSPTSTYSGSPLNGFCTPANRVEAVATDFPIAVGAGGASSSNGNNTTFGGLVAAAGGKGGLGQQPFPGPAIMGGPGGSGGGGGGGNPGADFATGGTGNDPATSPPQGKNGGGGAHNPGNWAGGGGGGGAGAAGASSSPYTTPAPGATAGAGGNGVASSITGSPVTRAGGGGGGGVLCGQSFIAGGSGGGGKGNAGPGSPDQSSAGTANTGGGGGANYPGSGGGKTGGSGIVIIRYRFQ